MTRGPENQGLDLDAVYAPQYSAWSMFRSPHVYLALRMVGAEPGLKGRFVYQVERSLSSLYPRRHYQCNFINTYDNLNVWELFHC